MSGMQYADWKEWNIWSKVVSRRLQLIISLESIRTRRFLVRACFQKFVIELVKGRGFQNEEMLAKKEDTPSLSSTTGVYEILRRYLSLGCEHIEVRLRGVEADCELFGE